MINILFCGNKKVFKGILLSTLSICRHATDAINVYIATADLTYINKEFEPITKALTDILETEIKKTNINNKVTLITLGEEFKNWITNNKNKSNFYTPFAFLRLFADTMNILPSKIIYLDTDIMATGDISTLFSENVENYEFGAVVDHLGTLFIKHNYFNSGVMLMNLKEIRKSELLKKSRTMCANKKMAFPDQSALNKLAKKVKYLPQKFNEQRNRKRDTILQHFCKRIKWLPLPKTLNIKPWQFNEIKKIYKINYFDEIYERFLEIQNIYNEDF